MCQNKLGIFILLTIEYFCILFDKIVWLKKVLLCICVFDYYPINFDIQKTHCGFDFTQLVEVINEVLNTNNVLWILLLG